MKVTTTKKELNKKMQLLHFLEQLKRLQKLLPNDTRAIKSLRACIVRELEK
jgi:hypothetical protein